MKITEKMWDYEGRKYIGIDKVIFKVPWRYNRVMGLDIIGTTQSLQMIEEGTIVKSFDFKTVKWDDQEYKVLTRIVF
jgi:hypothetical protein